MFKPQGLYDYICQQWQEEILPSLCDYIKILINLLTLMQNGKNMVIWSRQLITLPIGVSRMLPKE